MTNYRLLQYSTFERGKLPKGLSLIRDNKQSTTIALDSTRDKISTSQEELLIHEMTTSRLLRTRPKRTPIKGSESSHKMTYRLLDKEDLLVHETIKNLDYRSTRTNKSRQPISKATSQSAVKRKNTIHQNVKSTQADSHPHKSQEDNLISDGLHLRDIFREFLLRTANGNASPIKDKFTEGRKDLTNPKA